MKKAKENIEVVINRIEKIRFWKLFKSWQICLPGRLPGGLFHRIGTAFLQVQPPQITSLGLGSIRFLLFGLTHLSVLHFSLIKSAMCRPGFFKHDLSTMISSHLDFLIITKWWRKLANSLLFCNCLHLRKFKFCQGRKIIPEICKWN